MEVMIETKDASQPITHTAITTYIKGPFYCVAVSGHDAEDDIPRIFKYPIDTLFRVVETYGESLSDNIYIQQ